MNEVWIALALVFAALFAFRGPGTGAHQSAHR